jgi:hypothetical protein
LTNWLTNWLRSDQLAELDQLARYQDQLAEFNQLAYFLLYDVTGVDFNFLFYSTAGLNSPRTRFARSRSW